MPMLYGLIFNSAERAVIRKALTAYKTDNVQQDGPRKAVLEMLRKPTKVAKTDNT
jgi:hypothetical protein